MTDAHGQDPAEKKPDDAPNGAPVPPIDGSAAGHQPGQPEAASPYGQPQQPSQPQAPEQPHAPEQPQAPGSPYGQQPGQPPFGAPAGQSQPGQSQPGQFGQPPQGAPHSQQPPQQPFGAPNGQPQEQPGHYGQPQGQPGQNGQYGQPQGQPGQYGQPQGQPGQYGQQGQPPYGQQPGQPYGQPGHGGPGGPVPPQFGGQPGYGPQPLSPADDKLWASLSHFLGVLWLLPSLIIFLVFKDRGPRVREESKEALNWQITFLIGYIALSIVIGIIQAILYSTGAYGIAGIFGLLQGALYVVNLVFSIIGGVRVTQGGSYRYPFSLRLIK